MKVRCVRLFAPDGTELEKSPWMKIGSVYTVLSLTMEPGARPELRIIGEERNTPALFSMDELEIVDHSMPRNWEIHFQDGVLDIGPAAWLPVGYWDRFFDGDPDAVSVFERERAVMLERGGLG